MAINAWGRLLIAALLLISVSLAPVQGVAAQASQVETGVEGNSYTSPEFGYELVWARDWQVTDEAVEDGYNLLVLDNGVSSVYFVGSATDFSPAECLDERITGLEETDGVSFLQATEDENGDPLAGSENGREWAVYDFVYTGEDGAEIELRQYIDCRQIVAGESLLVITALMPAAEFESQVDPLLDLLDGLDIGGGGTARADDPDETGADEPASGDLDAWVAVSAHDINAFWEREFPRISNGVQYAEPAGHIAFSDTVDTACGSAAVMEVGPFYCPPDQTIYYDMAFAEIQIEAFGSPSVIAVVMAHEVGHHVQNLMQWRECEQTPCLDPAEMTSQEFELQADCFAGAWVADAETRGRMGSFDVETNITQFAQWLGDEGVGNTADPGAHGKAASRVYWFLHGYFFGVESCLTISAATDPARHGGTATGGEPVEQPTPAATEEVALDPTPETGGDLLTIGDEFTVVLRGDTVTMSVTDTEFVDELEGITPEGRFLIVYATVQRDADAPGPLRYRSFIVTDAAGNDYRLAVDATDTLLRTVFPDGIEENLDLDASYNVAFVFDVEPGAAGFVFSTTQGDGAVDLEV